MDMIIAYDIYRCNAILEGVCEWLPVGVVEEQI